MSLETTLINFPIKSPIYNASGPQCTTLNELVRLAQSKSSVILTKSCTYLPREGNPQPRYWGQIGPTKSINSTGLANLGYKFYGEHAKGFVKKCPEKPYIISIAGLTLEDNIKIIDYYHQLPLDHQPKALEINLSCPNVIGKSQVSYDPDAIKNYLTKIYDITFYQDNKIPYGVKLSPYFDYQHFQNTAEVLKEFPISFVTCINSPGHCLYIDTESETTRIRPNKGHGGIGGSSVLPIALANVHTFRELLPDRIEVIGCGGVTTGEDVFQHILVGAQAVQVGSQLMEEGPKVFERLNKELLTIMSKKGYKTLDDFRGKLQIA